MGVAASLEEKMGHLVQRLLMPKEVPAFYAVGRPQSFPEAPPDSLLLLAHITLEATPGAGGGAAAARRFYVEGLGALPEEPGGRDAFRARAGPTQLRLAEPPPGGGPSGLAQVWPGHLYLWVEDSRATYDACVALQQAMGCELIEEVHSLTAENAVDLLVMRDPGVTSRVLVNQAPKGGLVEKIRALSGTSEVKSSNLLAIIDATHMVAAGTGPGVARFYRHFLGAAVSQQRGGHAVHFSLGPALHQTLTFVEDEAVLPVGQSLVGQAPVPSVCLYMPSRESFKRAFDRCAEDRLLFGAAVWEEVSQACEFCFRTCLDPDSREVVLELLHIVRLQEHPEWPLASGAAIREAEPAHQQQPAGLHSPQEAVVSDARFTLADVAKHDNKGDAWIALNGKVLDVTRWIDAHPGGAQILLAHVGTDVSAQWNVIHQPGTLERQLGHAQGPRIVGLLAGEADAVLGA